MQWHIYTYVYNIFGHIPEQWVYVEMKAEVVTGKEKRENKISGRETNG